MSLMYLRLSDLPPKEWMQFFKAERQFPRHSMWRRAWIQGSTIIVDCVPEELERHHLKDLKEDVANANAKFRTYLAREEHRAQAAAEVKQRERERIEQLRDRLNFD